MVKENNMRQGSVLSLFVLVLIVIGALVLFISNNSPETIEKVKSGILSKSEELANKIKDPIVLARMKISDAENVYRNLVADIELKKEKLAEESKRLKILKRNYIQKLNNMKKNNVKLDKETYDSMLAKKRLIESKEKYIRFLRDSIKRETKLVDSLKTRLAQMYTEFNILKDKVNTLKAESGYEKITENDFNKMTDNVFNFTLKDLIKEEDTKILKTKSKNKANETINSIKKQVNQQYNPNPNYQDLTIN